MGSVGEMLFRNLVILSAVTIFVVVAKPVDLEEVAEKVQKKSEDYIPDEEEVKYEVPEVPEVIREPEGYEIPIIEEPHVHEPEIPAEVKEYIPKIHEKPDIPEPEIPPVEEEEVQPEIHPEPKEEKPKVHPEPYHPELPIDHPSVDVIYEGIEKPIDDEVNPGGPIIPSPPEEIPEIPEYIPEVSQHPNKEKMFPSWSSSSLPSHLPFPGNMGIPGMKGPGVRTPMHVIQSWVIQEAIYPE
ncbi:hypothetical protein DMENIID0001_142750 [Sergentomyia squamirostris]